MNLNDEVYETESDVWDDHEGIRKIHTTESHLTELKLKLSSDYVDTETEINRIGNLNEKDIADLGDDDEEDEGTVHTVASRMSADPFGNSAFDLALRVKLHRKYHQAVRKLDSPDIASWVNGVGISSNICPIQRTYYENTRNRTPVQELRMRTVGVAAGSGAVLVFWDIEMGTILKSVPDPNRSAILCVAVSSPLSRQKLAPLVACGHADGRLVLKDMMTGVTLLTSISSIIHPAPVRACHICEGQQKPLAIAASFDSDPNANPIAKPSLFVYNFERGSLACPPICDHIEQITAITSVSVNLMHSLFISASFDGYIHIYDMESCERLISLSPQINTGGPVFGLDIIPGSLTGNRPTLLLSAGMDGVIRVYNLGVGPVKPAASSTIDNNVDISIQRSAAENIVPTLPGRRRKSTFGTNSIQLTNENASKKARRNNYATSLHGHKGKAFCVAGLQTITLGCASGGEDGTVRIWNLETGQQLLCIRDQHTADVRSICTTLVPRPIIVTGGYDSKVFTFDLSISTNGDHRNAMKSLMTRRLFIAKKNNATASSHLQEEAGVLGRRTLVKADMKGGAGLLEKRSSVLSPSRKANVLGAKVEGAVTVTIEEKKLSRRESKRLSKIEKRKPIDANTGEDEGTGSGKSSNNDVEAVVTRERKITVISMANLQMSIEKSGMNGIIEEDDDEDDSDSEADSHPDGYDSDYVSLTSAQRYRQDLEAKKKKE